MRPVQRDFSILNKLNLERAPIGVKYLLNKPDGVEKLDKKLAFCEMLGEAQNRSPFFASKEEFECIGPLFLGMAEPDIVFESGLVGPREGIYEEARANQRIYPGMPRITKGTVRYVVFSPVNELPFEPDVLIITAKPQQAAIVLRAMCYSTGRELSSKATPIGMCAWLYIYPFISGELNYTFTGLSYGMTFRKVLPEGLILVSIPYDLLPSMLENLQNMEWIPRSYGISQTSEEHTEYVDRLHEELMQEYLAG